MYCKFSCRSHAASSRARNCVSESGSGTMNTTPHGGDLYRPLRKKVDAGFKDALIQTFRSVATRFNRPKSRVASGLTHPTQIQCVMKLHDPLALLLVAASMTQTRLPSRQSRARRIAESHSAPVVNKRYEIVTRGGAGAEPPVAVVYLEGSFPQRHPRLSSNHPDNFTFVRHCCQCWWVRKWSFRSRQHFPQYILVLPSKRFDLGRYRPDEKPVPSQVFDKPGW